MATHEEKRERFERVLATRLPKAVKAVELLANMSRKSDYAYLPAEVQDMLDQLDTAVDMVATAFGALPADRDAPPLLAAGEHRIRPPEQVDDVPAEARPSGGGRGPVAPPKGVQVHLDQRAEVRWAYDALKRGDAKLAKDRMRRVIEAWIEEERTK